LHLETRLYPVSSSSFLPFPRFFFSSLLPAFTTQNKKDYRLKAGFPFKPDKYGSSLFAARLE
jgi:hypothetical protein